jgi:small conductance mechanosensitive channel
MLNTPDKKLVIIPNGPLSTDALTNILLKLCEEDWKFGIAYGDDVENFKKAMILLLKTAEF